MGNPSTEEEQNIIKRIGRFALGVLTTFLTFVAAYELLSASRSYPHFHAVLESCGESMDEKTSHEANLFFHSNIENAVYFDLLLYQGCYEQSPVSLNFDTRQDSEVPNASINLEIIRSKLADKTLTYAGDPGADVNAERIRGVFFLKGEIDAGTFFLEALPVPYSSDAQRKFTCTKSLSETSDRSYLKKAEAYVRSCIFEQPWDPWGWGTLN